MTRALSAEPDRRSGAAPTAWFPVDESAPGHARRHVAAALTARDVTGEIGDDAVLLVSELVTNVFQHTLSDEVGVGVDVTADLVSVEVHESFPGDPEAARRIVAGASHTATHDATGGRGLRIVDARAARWGLSRSADTCCVWFTLART